MNQRGQIVGDLYDENGRYRAALWDRDAKMRYLGPENRFSSAIAINGLGHVLIHELEKGLCLYLEPGKIVQLEIPSHLPAEGHALNDADQVVGAYGPFSETNRAFVWSEKSGLLDLNDSIPADSGWTLQVATAISNRGAIVGLGQHNGKEDVGFLLQPQTPSLHSKR